ncbi:hypothetical protein [Streptomyces sp. NPDC020298]|uniref:hypothetical protein n=1 Tax=unclassified Streptomyces TaxID=2593676 RepID=UPI0033CBB3F7
MIQPLRAATRPGGRRPSWLLPRRRSLRTSRMPAAGAGLGFALLPVLWLMVAIAVVPSS